MNILIIYLITSVVTITAVSATDELLYYYFGYEFPESINQTPISLSWSQYLLLNIEFNDTYYLIAYEIYATTADAEGTFQLGISKLNQQNGYENCWPNVSGLSCAQYLSEEIEINRTEKIFTNNRTFAVNQSGHNYLMLPEPIRVNKGDMIELRQTAAIVAMEMNTSAPYGECVYFNSISNANDYSLFFGYYGIKYRMMVRAITVALNSTTKTTSTRTTKTGSTTTTVLLEITTDTSSSDDGKINMSPELLANLLSSSNSSLYATNDLTGCLLNCSNNGYCSLNRTSNEIKCVCNQNFTGTACQTDLRPCSSSPCLNGATCIDYLDNKTMTLSYYCVCTSYLYFAGRMCQYQLDLCVNESCSNNGVCYTDYSALGSAVCKCFQNYYGAHCESMDEELRSIQTFISISSTIAMVILVSFYLLFCLCDLHTFMMIKRRRRRQRGRQVRAQQETTSELIIHYLYVN